MSDLASACTICGSPNTHVVDSIPSPYLAATYRLFSCRECTSEFFLLADADADLEALYEEQASEGQYRAKEKFSPSPYWRREVRLLRNLRGPVASVLDVGCRTGDFLLHWPQTVERIGIELSSRAAGIAVARGLVVETSPVEDYHPGRQFGIVCAYAVVEHLAEPRKFLESLGSLVEPGGVAAIMIPTHQSVKARVLTKLGRTWSMYTPPLHLNFIARKALDRRMEAAGFALIHRRFASGGLINPFRRVPVLGGAWSRFMLWADMHSPSARLPLFDHMYSYYKRSP